MSKSVSGYRELTSPVNVRTGNDSETSVPLLSPRPKKTFFQRLKSIFTRSNDDEGPRVIPLQGKALRPPVKYPKNVVVNHKYNIITFLPMCLYEQFKQFFNLYFLLTAISQCIPELMVGFWFSFVAPLVFVLLLSLSKEAYDDLKRWRRDKQMNSEKYSKLDPVTGEVIQIESSDITVGTYLLLAPNQRIPADCVLLHTTEKTGASFLRTDQLDGETDWKLRFPVRVTQQCTTHQQIVNCTGELQVDPPTKEVYKFCGVVNTPEGCISLDLSNTLWANCVVATGHCVCVVIYSGKDTRCAMNQSTPSAKQGRLEEELNQLSYYLFGIMFFASLLLVGLQQFQGEWILSLIRFIVLLSTIIPISMRVNLDIAKILYSLFIMTDKKIEGVVVRNSNLPEELGRVWYLFSDKTGTLTKNEMEFRRLILGHQWKLDWDNRADIEYAVSTFFAPAGAVSESRGREIAGYSDEQLSALGSCILWISLCHNVTPVMDEEVGERVYQASSPDEVALVKFCEKAGLTLVERTLTSMTVETKHKNQITFEIVKDFPFTSDRKRMGIILRNATKNEYVFLMKGADVVMQKIIRGADWLEESCSDLAKEGLRTLVFGAKNMSEQEVTGFLSELERANTVLGQGRADAVAMVMNSLEQGLKLVGITGVEDKLQDDVQISLETMSACNIRVWMLTGDKVETATCIARSTQMIRKSYDVYTFSCKTVEEAIAELEETDNVLARRTKSLEMANSCGYAVVVDGTTLDFFLKHCEERFILFAKNAGAVVVARCSPTQKADVVRAVKKMSPSDARTAAIGDGGNDVSMILAAHVGIGVEGKEGKHASLAGDFSIKQFSDVVRLFVWHGRNSYKRSCRLSQFIIHRGVVIAVIQVIFSLVFNYVSVSVYSSWLVVGYATVYTMLPVFCLVLDEDTVEENVVQFPPLYASLQKGRSLNLRTFLTWIWISLYQGGVIMCLGIYMFNNDMYKVVAITFTSLIINELLTVFFEMHMRILWKQRRRNLYLFIAVELLSITVYLCSLFLMQQLRMNLLFDVDALKDSVFWNNVAVVSLTATLPILLVRELWPSKSVAHKTNTEQSYVSRFWGKLRRTLV